MSKIEIWEEYLQHFGLKPNAIRKECEPCFIVNNELKDNAIVLIHGLTDSPFFMKAIGQYFHDVMGFNVFMPLLDGHGLKQPDGMRKVTLKKWENNVKYAVDFAKQYGKKISIGGLSTGGALSVHQALDPNGGISGGIFLFSAALDLTSKYGPVPGELTEFFLRLPIAKILADIQDLKDLQGDNPLIGENPYRYAKMDIDGAIQLKKVIQEIDEKIRKGYKISQPVFAAHSEADETANLEAIKNLEERCQIYQLFQIHKNLNVAHASVVLKDNIQVNGKNGEVKVLEKKNPLFEEMMKTAKNMQENTMNFSSIKFRTRATV